MNEWSDPGELALRLSEAADAQRDREIVDVLGRIARFAGVHRAYTTLFLDDGTFENTHEWTGAGIPTQVPVIRRLEAATFPYSIGLARGGEVLSCPDISRLPPAAAAEQRSFGAFGVQGVLQVPIVAGGRTIGVIGLNDFTPRGSWPADLVTGLRDVGRAIGVVMASRLADRHLDRERRHAIVAGELQERLAEYIGHELRTPLHAILGYAELLELDGGTNLDREALLQIQFHGRRVVARCEDMALLAAGGGDDVVVPVDDLLGEVVAELAPVATARGVELIHEPDPASEAAVRSRPGRVHQVLFCALSSALQSLDARAITAGARAARPAAAPVHVTVVVRTDRTVQEVTATMQLAAALVDGLGRFEVTERRPGEVVVEIVLDQLARP